VSLIPDTSDDFDLPVGLALAGGAIADPDALPTFRAYGPSGVVGSGTLARYPGGTITNVQQAGGDIVVTAAGHGLEAGAVVDVSGVGGATGANGRAILAAADADTFTYPGTTGGAYTAGGAWNPAGIWTVPIGGSLRSALEPGVLYEFAVTWAEAGSPTMHAFSLVPQ
jgi:hypothetical protein